MPYNIQGSASKRIVPALLGALGASCGLLLLFAALAPGAAQATAPAAAQAQAAALTQTVAATATEYLTGYIVVQPGPSNVAVRAITFTEPISGLAALLRSGLDVTVAEIIDWLAPTW